MHGTSTVTDSCKRVQYCPPSTETSTCSVALGLRQGTSSDAGSHVSVASSTRVAAITIGGLGSLELQRETIRLSQEPSVTYLADPLQSSLSS